MDHTEEIRIGNTADVFGCGAFPPAGERFSGSCSALEPRDLVHC